MNMRMDMPSICLVMPSERLDGSDSCSFGPLLLCLLQTRSRPQALWLNRRVVLCLHTLRVVKRINRCQRITSSARPFLQWDTQPLNVILMRFLKLLMLHFSCFDNSYCS